MTRFTDYLLDAYEGGHEGVSPEAFIHQMAWVDHSSCHIGAKSKVWQFATVIQGTVLGENCIVGAGAVLSGPVFGDRCKISSGVVMGPGFKVGNDVFLGPNVVLANDMWPETETEGWDAEALRTGKMCVIVEDGASIGANAVVLPGVRIGKGAIVAAGAVCDRDVPDGHLWRRNDYLSPVRKDRRMKRMRFAQEKTGLAAANEAYNAEKALHEQEIALQKQCGII